MSVGQRVWEAIGLCLLFLAAGIVIPLQLVGSGITKTEDIIRRLPNWLQIIIAIPIALLVVLVISASPS